jgi:GntR family transcriptional regulator
MLREQHLRKVEDALSEAIRAAEIAGMGDEELMQTLQTLLAVREEQC